MCCYKALKKLKPEENNKINVIKLKSTTRFTSNYKKNHFELLLNNVDFFNFHKTSFELEIIFQ